MELKYLSKTIIWRYAATQDRMPQGLVIFQFSAQYVPLANAKIGYKDKGRNRRQNSSKNCCNCT